MNLERFVWGAFRVFNSSNCQKIFPNAQSNKRMVTYHSLCHNECWIYHPPCCVILHDTSSKAMTALFLFLVFLVLSGSCGSPLGCSDNPLELPGHFSLFSVQQRKQIYINKQANFSFFFSAWIPSNKILKVLLRRNLSKKKTKTNKGKGRNLVYLMENSLNKTNKHQQQIEKAAIHLLLSALRLRGT